MAGQLPYKFGRLDLGVGIDGQTFDEMGPEQGQAQSRPFHLVFFECVRIVLGCFLDDIEDHNRSILIFGH